MATLLSPISTLYHWQPQAEWYSVLIVGESNVAIDPAIGGYGAADIYLGEFSPHYTMTKTRRVGVLGPEGGVDLRGLPIEARLGKVLGLQGLQGRVA